MSKWHGAGNDFVVVDGRGIEPPADWAAWTRAACDRRRGLGADGALVLEPDDEHDFRMHYRNADGSEAAMCGNGGRVLAAFAVERGLGREGRVRFRSRWGAHGAEVEAEAARRYRVRLGLPDVPPPERRRLSTPWGDAEAWYVRPGVPHLVFDLAELPAASLAEVPVEGWGPRLRHHERLGPEGANVDFVERRRGEYAVRTFERGVESETLACGTGATAVAAAAAATGARSPVRVRTWSGDLLGVEFTSVSGRLETVILVGPAVRVFETDYDPL